VFWTGSRFSNRGCLMSLALALRSAANSAILRVYASASWARLRAFWNREVAINSIVRVILWMFWIALRRLTRARVLAMWVARCSAFRLPVLYEPSPICPFRNRGKGDCQGRQACEDRDPGSVSPFG